MAKKYALTEEFSAITETRGTVQNVGIEAVELVSASHVVPGDGIVLMPGDQKTFKGALSARSLGSAGATLNVVDFTDAGGGGDADDLQTLTNADIVDGTDTTGKLISAKLLSDYVSSGLADLVSSAPETLDTLKEIAAALGDDPNFATTIMLEIGKKLDKNAKAKSAENADSADSVAWANVKNTPTTIAGYGITDAPTKAGLGASGKWGIDISGDAATVGGHEVGANVPADAEFTDTTYSTATESAAGLMPAVDKVKVNNIVHSAEAHNGIFRGKDLTSYFDSGQMSTDIANGKFDDIYIGDFITKTINLPAITYTDKAGNERTQDAQTFTNVKWYVAAIDPHIHCGDTETTAHHVLLIPASTLQRNVKMDPTNDATGGYIGSGMWRVHMPNWANAIKTAFGSGHVLKHRELLANAIDATAPSGAGAGWVGTASGWAWTDVEVNIPNEQMIYGGRVWGSGFDGGDFPRILPLYALKCSHLDDRSWFWLRAVASASIFACAGYRGNAANDNASRASDTGGIRPLFPAQIRRSTNG